MLISNHRGEDIPKEIVAVKNPDGKWQPCATTESETVTFEPVNTSTLLDADPGDIADDKKPLRPVSELVTHSEAVELLSPEGHVNDVNSLPESCSCGTLAQGEADV